MIMEPLFDKVVVVRDEAAEKSLGGILLPDTAKEKPKRGRIVAIGIGRYNPNTNEFIPMSVKVNDHVLFNSYAGSEVEVQGQTCLIMGQEDILAVLRGK